MGDDHLDDCIDDGVCPQCGGDGVIMLSEAGPSEWGEDTFCVEDEPITCPTCKGRAAQ